MISLTTAMRLIDLLLDQHHFPNLAVMFLWVACRCCIEPVEVDAARQSICINLNCLLPWLFCCVYERSYLLPEYIVKVKIDAGFVWQLILDRCCRVERVGVVLRQRK